MRGTLDTKGVATAAEFSSCHRKRRYKSLRLARREVERVLELFGRYTGYYLCRSCRGYHLYSKRQG